MTKTRRRDLYLFMLASVEVEFGDELLVFVFEILACLLLSRQPKSPVVAHRLLSRLPAPYMLST